MSWFVKVFVSIRLVMLSFSFKLSIWSCGYVGTLEEIFKGVSHNMNMILKVLCWGIIQFDVYIIYIYFFFQGSRTLTFLFGAGQLAWPLLLTMTNQGRIRINTTEKGNTTFYLELGLPEWNLSLRNRLVFSYYFIYVEYLRSRCFLYLCGSWYKGIPPRAAPERPLKWWQRSQPGSGYEWCQSHWAEHLHDERERW